MNANYQPQGSELEAYEQAYEYEGEGEIAGEAGQEMEFRRRRRWGRGQGELAGEGETFEAEGELEGELEGEMDAEDEAGASNAFLELANEGELEQFLPLLIGPLLKGVAPMLLQAAGPLLGSIGRRVLGATNAPAREQEVEGFFLGKLLGGLFGGGRRELEQEGEYAFEGEGEGEGEGELWRYRRFHHPWRRRWGWGALPPPPPPAYAEPPTEEVAGEQEQFLGNILRGLLGEVEGYHPIDRRVASAHWFVRLARRTAFHAARAARSHAASGQPLSRQAVQRIVEDALMKAARPRRGAGCGCSRSNGMSVAQGNGASGTWVRQGNSIVIRL